MSPEHETDLRDMVRAVKFSADLLRTELGPGGLMERESEALRASWALAIDSLEAAATIPMIPLFFWRERKAQETPDSRRVEIVKVTNAAAPGDCPSYCDGAR